MTETVTEERVQSAEREAEQQVENAAEVAKQQAEQQGLSEAEVTQKVEQARTEEKNKLYPQIKELKDSLAEIQQALREEREEKTRIKNEAQAQAERERQAQLSDSERMQEVLNRLEEQLNSERLERQKLRQDIENRDHQSELKTYRERLIKANEDEIIPELVRGNSVEEINDSLEIAKARFKEIEEQLKQRQGDTTRRNMPRPTNPDIEALEEQELSRDLTTLDRDKYLKDESYRKQIQAELANEYARLAGRR